eukprot:gene25564-46635_t
MATARWGGSLIARDPSTMANAKSPKKQRPRRTVLQSLIYGTLVLSVWALIFVVAFFAVFATDLPDTSQLYSAQRQRSVSYLDRSGGLLAVRGSQAAATVDLDKLPPYVPKAFIAIEDRWYYWHFGFNPWGIARSQIYNMQHRGEGGPLRGGSTITQQVAKNVLLTSDATVGRKLKEAILARRLEQTLTKDRILELYLNEIWL